MEIKWTTAMTNDPGTDATDMWWWLSFADDSGCLGIAIVKGKSVGDAAAEARRLRINPGGEVLGHPFPDDDVDAKKERERWGVNRLIDPEDLRADGYRKRGELRGSIGDARNDKGETFRDYEARIGQSVCEDHNKKLEKDG